MSDALVSPPVGLTMWAVSAAAIVYSVKRIRQNEQASSISPLMGMMGAFVFAAQMINFTIPLTGSSGHLGGGILLAVILGPWAGLIAMASVLAIQALFFADGGLLAYGCNLFNLGVIPCLIAFPLIYRPIDRPGTAHGKSRTIWASMIAAIAGLQAGAFCVVLETVISGITKLPFTHFTLLMQSIHLPIGIVEGAATAAVILFVRQIQPALVQRYDDASSLSASLGKKGAALLLSLVVVTGAGLSWCASQQPDGLEWSLASASGHEEPTTPKTTAHQTAETLQQSLSLLPDYGFRTEEPETAESANAIEAGASEAWPNINAGTTVSGLAGASLMLLIALAFGIFLRKKKDHQRPCKR